MLVATLGTRKAGIKSQSSVPSYYTSVTTGGFPSALEEKHEEDSQMLVSCLLKFIFQVAEISAPWDRKMNSQQVALIPSLVNANKILLFF